MSLHPWLRRCSAWIALLAVCFGALAPTLTQAALNTQGPGAGHWVQLCSASGISWVRADAGDPAGEQRADTTLTCPWGAISGGAAGLPPVHARVLPDTGPAAVPLAQAQRGASQAPSRHASARAPPPGI